MEQFYESKFTMGIDRDRNSVLIPNIYSGSLNGDLLFRKRCNNCHTLAKYIRWHNIFPYPRSFESSPKRASIDQARLREGIEKSKINVQYPCK